MASRKTRRKGRTGSKRKSTDGQVFDGGEAYAVFGWKGCAAICASFAALVIISITWKKVAAHRALEPARRHQARHEKEHRRMLSLLGEHDVYMGARDGSVSGGGLQGRIRRVHLVPVDETRSHEEPRATLRGAVNKAV